MISCLMAASLAVVTLAVAIGTGLWFFRDEDDLETDYHDDLDR